MTNLSPAAQAVSNAAKSSLDWEAGYLPNTVAAAALRVVADQVEQKWRGFSHEACQEIRAIAAELEGAQ